MEKLMTKKSLGYVGKTLCNALHSSVAVKEIKIPVPWGHLAGKLWGSEQKRPILALHGWQDNCGSWDPLAPLICDKIPILAIDWAGHGKSSWLPPGFIYNDVWDFVPHIITIKNYFKWDKISMLGHSLGSVAGLQYAGLYPDDVDLCIAVENIVFQEYDLDTVLKTLPKLIKKKEMCQHLLDTKLTHGTMEELTDKWYAGMMKSIKRENFHYLMKRGVKPSPKDPTKFCFTKDIRLKYETVKPSKSEFLEKIVERISCPLLYFKATGSSYKLSDPHCCRVQEILKKNNPNYDSHNVDGTHHVHVNNPEVLQPIIVDFLRKHKLIDE